MDEENGNKSEDNAGQHDLNWQGSHKGGSEGEVRIIGTMKANEG